MASGRCRFLRRRVRPFWKPIVVVAAPLLFLPLSLNGTPVSAGSNPLQNNRKQIEPHLW